MTRILVMGLPGSGKTTLANKLSDKLQPDCLWLNADIIRKKQNDWDFSLDGRLRQAIRIREYADQSKNSFVIADFVCPLPEMRAVYNADITIWMDTIVASIFEDTNNLFVPPENYDFRITEQNADKWATHIYNTIINFSYRIN